MMLMDKKIVPNQSLSQENMDERGISRQGASFFKTIYTFLHAYFVLLCCYICTMR
jgi:hypothetical protein